MKIAFSTLGCPEWSFKDIISTAKDMGFDGIEIRGIQNELFAPEIREFQDEKINETIGILNGLDLRITCFSTACYLFDKENEEKVINDACSYIDLACKMNVPYVRVLGDTNPQPSDDIDDYYVARVLNEIALYGKNKHVMPLIETNGVFADTERLVRLLSAVNDNAGILWDINHPYRYFNENPADTYKRIASNLKYVHFKDSIKENGIIKYKMPGYGDLPVTEIVEILSKNNYNGYISLEWVKRWYSDLEDPGVVFMHFVHYINKIKRKVS